MLVEEHDPLSSEMGTIILIPNVSMAKLHITFLGKSKKTYFFRVKVKGAMREQCVTITFSRLPSIRHTMPACTVFLCGSTSDTAWTISGLTGWSKVKIINGMGFIINFWEKECSEMANSLSESFKNC